MLPTLVSTIALNVWMVVHYCVLLITHLVLSVNTVNMSDTMIDVSIDVSNLVTNMSLIQRMQAPAITLPSDFLAERFASAGMTQRLPITTVVIRNLQNYLPAVVLNTTR